MAEFNEEHEATGAVSKAEAVRRAVAAGMESPGDGVAYVKQHFGFDLAKPMWSGYRAQMKARDAKKSGEAPRARAEHAPASGLPTGFSADVKELRGLIETAGGADELKELIGQMSGLVGKYGAGGLSELNDAIG